MKLNIPNVLKCLEESLDAENKAREKHEYRHNPSSASVKTDDGKIIGACLRQLYYKATELPVSNPKDFTSELQAGFGQAIHDWFFAKLKNHKSLSLDSEIPYKAHVDPLTHEVSWRVDGLITHKGEKGGLELKTKQGYGLQKMIKEGGADKKDIAQVLTYFNLDKELLWYVLVYLARDSGYRAEYHIWRDLENKHLFKIKPITPEGNTRDITEITWQKIQDRWNDLEYHLSNKSIPARDFKVVLKDDGSVVPYRTKGGDKIKSDWQCLYCNWSDHCWKQPGAYEDSYNLQFFAKNSK